MTAGDLLVDRRPGLAGPVVHPDVPRRPESLPSGRAGRPSAPGGDLRPATGARRGSPLLDAPPVPAPAGQVDSIRRHRGPEIGPSSRDNRP
jgi:hypothetical protein